MRSTNLAKSKKLPKISETEAYGRMIAAARSLAGLQQQQLGLIAGVSGATISNCETGKNYPQTATRRALRSTLKDLGVTCTFDGDNGNVTLTTHFDF